MALAAQPRLLFLDEPTAGLGTEGTARLSALIHELKRTLTIVVIEHDMTFLFGLADRISVIHWGQVIAEGTPDELRADPWVRRSNLGRAGAMMLSVERIDTFYGETQVLYGVSLNAAGRRSRRAARSQRRRQDDARCARSWA